MEYKEILYTVLDRVLTITLNRPEKLNAFTGRMMGEILDALDHADADDDVRAIIFTGAGRAYCAGADLGGGSGTFDARERSADVGIEGQRDGGGRVSLRLYDCKKPLIAAINGPAVGVGVTMTLPMDIRLASTDARFGFVFARRGICLEAASSWFLPRVVGVSQALEWAYTGRVFPAAEAHAAGLVRSLHAPADLLPAARELAREIAAINGPAVGVGVTMTLPMDIRLASTEARFGFVFARRGICLEAASSWFLPRVVGVSQALEWAYTGRVFPAAEAHAAGLVRSLHAPAELLPAARELAREIADNTSAISVAMSRQMIWKMLGADHPMEAHKVDSRAITALGQSADAHEGVGSFLAKRKAEFRQKPSQDMPKFYPWWRERKFE